MRSSHQSCEKVRRDALAHLSGETSVLEKQRFKSHLERCAPCRQRVEAISSMLEAARSEPCLPTPAVRDRIFESLMDGIDETRRPVSRPMRRSLTPRPGRPFVYALVAAGVAVLAIPAIFIWRAANPHALGEGTPVADRSVASAPAIPPSSMRLKTVRPAANLILGLSPETRYSMDVDNHPYRLDLKEGLMWIRFDHSPEIQGLTVSSPDLAVQVIGTVLVVEVGEADNTSVGVLEGKVKVIPDKGDAILISAGDVRTPEGRVVAMNSGLKEQGAVWSADLLVPPGALPEKTDPSGVVSDNDGAMAVREEVKVQKNIEGGDGEELADLYVVAEGYMQAGSYDAAAETLERLIAAGPKSTRADTARLELARIYTKQLARPDRAATHLETYLERHPLGRKSDLVRKRLCHLSTDKVIHVAIPCR